MKRIMRYILAIFALTLISGVGAEAKAPKGRDTNIWAIDVTPLEVDGKHYAIWSGWRDNFEGTDDPRDLSCQHLFIAEMTFHKKAPLVRLGDRVELTSYDTYEWENEADQKIMEGPQILRNYKTDDVFVIYSCNGSWSHRYKLGQLKLKKGEDPLNPKSWIKRDKPVFTGVTKAHNRGYLVYGVGHASFITSPDDKETWIYYHAKTSPKGGWSDRRSYLQRIDFDSDGEPQMGTPAPIKNEMQRPSGECEIDKKLYNIESPSSTFTNPIIPNREYADPWITKHNGMYYTVRIERGAVWVTESPYISRFVDKDGNSIPWEQARVDGGWTPPKKGSGKWNETQFWAAELHNINERWYVFYAAGINEKAPFWSQRSGVLVSESGSVFGPYIEHDDKPLFTGEKNYIQPKR